jgi:NADH dehydrogenase [ubiquinone] 1 alpha subcomplex assembly factor 7
VRGHQKVDVFVAPGEMDLTAHVDFATLDLVARREGIASSLTTQGAWLTAMGIGLRAQALAKGAPARAEELRVAHERLVGREAMGELFKCMALSARDWPRGAGFPEGERRHAPDAA